MWLYLQYNFILTTQRHYQIWAEEHTTKPINFELFWVCSGCHWILRKSEQVKPEIWNSNMCVLLQALTSHTQMEPFSLIITSIGSEHSSPSTKWVAAREPCREPQSFVYWSEAEGRTHSSQGTCVDSHCQKVTDPTGDCVGTLLNCVTMQGWLHRNSPTSRYKQQTLISPSPVSWAAQGKSGGGTVLSFQGFSLWLVSVKLTCTIKAGGFLASGKKKKKRNVLLHRVFHCVEGEVESWAEHRFNTCRPLWWGQYWAADKRSSQSQDRKLKMNQNNNC